MTLTWELLASHAAAVMVGVFGTVFVLALARAAGKEGPK